MVFQPALLWFLQTRSCQPMGTALRYLPIQTLWFCPPTEVFQAPLAAEEWERRPALQGTARAAGRALLADSCCFGVTLLLALSFPLLLAVKLPEHLL